MVVLAEDTDILLLLCHHQHAGALGSNQIYMTSPCRFAKTCIDIDATVNLHSEIMPHVLQAHGGSGCDTVAKCHGIGKLTSLNVLKEGKIIIVSRLTI